MSQAHTHTRLTTSHKHTLTHPNTDSPVTTPAPQHIYIHPRHPYKSTTPPPLILFFYSFSFHSFSSFLSISRFSFFLSVHSLSLGSTALLSCNTTTHTLPCFSSPYFTSKFSQLPLPSNTKHFSTTHH